MPQFRSALALSGGSARALSHLGVLAELEQRRMKIDMVVGSSMGALIGGLYAYYRDSATVTEKLREFFQSELFLKTATVAVDDTSAQLGPDGFFNRFLWLFRRGVYYTHSMIRSQLIPEGLYHEIIGTIMPDVLIEDLPIPFAAVAMDLLTGEEIVLTRGSLRRAIAASSAIPGLFPVIEIGGRPLVDGGWADNVPAAPAIALGAHFVLAVDATLEISGMADYPQSGLEILFRCNEMTRILLTRHRKSVADALITPHIGKMFWADFKALDRCMAAGRRAFEQSARHVSRQLFLRRYRTLGGAIHPGRTGRWRHPFVII